MATTTTYGLLIFCVLWTAGFESIHPYEDLQMQSQELGVSQ